MIFAISLSDMVTDMVGVKFFSKCTNVSLHIIFQFDMLPEVEFFRTKFTNSNLCGVELHLIEVIQL